MYPAIYLIVKNDRKNFNQLGAEINASSFLRADFIQQYWSYVVDHLP